jgi:hypothetical protein
MKAFTMRWPRAFCGWVPTGSSRAMIDHSPDELEYPSSANNAVMWYLIVSLPGTIILILGA